MSELDLDFEIEQSHSYTPIKPVLKGEFSISNYSVPYFQANLSLQEVNRHLKLVEEMPNEERQQWTIEELFQRDIDWKRVENDIVTDYLKRKEKRSFFNALTVALLPKNADGKLTPTYLDTKQGSAPIEPPFDGANGFSVTEIGGIQIASRNSNSTNQYLRWDENSIFAATIDGQHRLAALKHYFNSSQGLSKKQIDTKIPVIFLVMDEAVGFDIPQEEIEQNENSLLSIVREVFIDLNKHATQVSSARQVLLDDLELESICTRMLLNKKTMVDSDENLPLGLINWKDDTVKFDSGIYFSSINVLYLVVKELLNIKYPSDPLDEDDIKKFLKSAEDSLFISAQMKKTEGKNYNIYKDKIGLQSYCLEKLREYEEPIKILPYEYSLAAQDSFANTYLPLIVGVFKTFTPYKEFWNLSKELGGVDGELAYYYSLNDKSQKHLKNNIWTEIEFEEKVKRKAEQLSHFKSKKWAFMVVWQKALIKATVYSYFQSSTVLGNKVSQDEFLVAWSEFLNYADAKGLFTLTVLLDEASPSEGNLWEGICQNPVSQTIKYSNAASKKISDLLLLYWYFYNSEHLKVDDFIKEISEFSSKYPNGVKLLSSIFSAMKSVATQRKGEVQDDVIDNYCKLRTTLILKRLKS